MANIAELDRKLNQMILEGKILDAFDRFYADDVVMQENETEPFRGKEVNRKREEEFVNSVETFHGAQLRGEAVTGDVSYGEWWMDITKKGAGRLQLSQVAARRWKDGKVVHEKFYYNAG